MSPVLKQGVVSVTAISLIALTLAVSCYDEQRPPYNLASSLATFPNTLQAWHSTESLMVDERTRQLLAATDYLGRSYRHDSSGSGVELFVAFYALQSPGVGPHAARNCLSAAWDITTMAPTQLATEEDTVSINRLLIRRTNAERLVLYWYQTPNRIVRDEYARKFFVAWDAMRFGHKAGAFVRLIVANDPHQEQQALAFGAAVAREMHRRLGNVVQAAATTTGQDIRF